MFITIETDRGEEITDVADHRTLKEIIADNGGKGRAVAIWKNGKRFSVNEIIVMGGQKGTL